MRSVWQKSSVHLCLYQWKHLEPQLLTCAVDFNTHELKVNEAYRLKENESVKKTGEHDS